MGGQKPFPQGRTHFLGTCGHGPVTEFDTPYDPGHSLPMLAGYWTERAALPQEKTALPLVAFGFFDNFGVFAEIFEYFAGTAGDTGKGIIGYVHRKIGFLAESFVEYSQVRAAPRQDYHKFE